MDATEAEVLFRKNYPRGEKSIEKGNPNLLELLNGLQYLPLGIKQAASYLQTTHLKSLSQYLDDFKTTKKLLSKPNDIDNPWRPGSNTETVVTTFHVTFDQIQQQSPLAGSLLHCMACIDRQGILRKLLLDLTKLQTDEQGLKYEDHKNLLEDALEKLINFSILQPMTDNEKLYEIHALVHFSMIHLLDANPEQNAAAITSVAKILAKLQLPKWEHSADWRIYSPHAMAVVINGKVGDTLDIARICEGASGYLSLARRNREESLRLAERARDVHVSVLGEDDIITLDIMRRLAIIYERWFKYEEAVRIVARMKKSVKRRER
ncbi:hypothetical protein FPQ18DRAFT_409383 [Pyronema domesticum]|nr:hypothetical protein FPQ18DRAFT_409383 [Pyronema domesticum]